MTILTLDFRHLSLATNQIEKISNLNGLNSLKILSLGRNNIKKLEGLDAVGDTLEELWISYNQIERLNGIECCKKLKIVYASNNKIKAWDGVDRLVSLPFVLSRLLIFGICRGNCHCLRISCCRIILWKKRPPRTVFGEMKYLKSFPA